MDIFLKLEAELERETKRLAEESQMRYKLWAEEADDRDMKEDAARNRGPGVRPVVVGSAWRRLLTGCLVAATTTDEALLSR